MKKPRNAGLFHCGRFILGFPAQMRDLFYAAAEPRQVPYFMQLASCRRDTNLFISGGRTIFFLGFPAQTRDLFYAAAEPRQVPFLWVAKKRYPLQRGRCLNYLYLKKRVKKSTSPAVRVLQISQQSHLEQLLIQSHRSHQYP